MCAICCCKGQNVFKFFLRKPVSSGGGGSDPSEGRSHGYQWPHHVLVCTCPPSRIRVHRGLCSVCGGLSTDLSSGQTWGEDDSIRFSSERMAFKSQHLEPQHFLGLETLNSPVVVRFPPCSHPVPGWLLFCYLPLSCAPFLLCLYWIPGP